MSLRSNHFHFSTLPLVAKYIAETAIKYFINVGTTDESHRKRDGGIKNLLQR